MKVMDFIVFFSLLVILGFSLFVLWDNIPRDSAEYYEESNSPASVSGNSSYNSQFYPSMRYQEKDISFEIDSDCSDTKRGNILEAFDIISEKTILSFHESGRGEIK